MCWCTNNKEREVRVNKLYAIVTFQFKLWSLILEALHQNLGTTEFILFRRMLSDQEYLGKTLFALENSN